MARGCIMSAVATSILSFLLVVLLKAEVGFCHQACVDNRTMFCPRFCCVNKTESSDEFCCRICSLSVDAETRGSSNCVDLTPLLIGALLFFCFFLVMMLFGFACQVGMKWCEIACAGGTFCRGGVNRPRREVDEDAATPFDTTRHQRLMTPAQAMGMQPVMAQQPPLMVASQPIMTSQPMVTQQPQQMMTSQPMVMQQPMLTQQPQQMMSGGASWGASSLPTPYTSKA